MTARPDRQPNMLFIYADQHRADVLGCAGNDTVVTPHLDQLPNEGVRFLCAASMSRSIQTMDPYWSRSQLDRHGSGHLGHREEDVVGRWKVGGACLREAVSVDPGVVKTD